MRFVPLDCLQFKRKRSLKVDRATSCTEWKSAFIQASTKASDDLKIPFTHSLVLALSANWEFNQKRGDLLRPHLNSWYAALCNPSTSISTELFGDNIGKEIDELTKKNLVATIRIIRHFAVLKSHHHSDVATTETRITA